MSDIFENDPYLAPPSARSGRGGTRPPGIDDPDYDPWNAPAEAAEPAIDQPEAVDPAAPWAEYDAPRLEPPTKVKKKGQWTCPQHGPLCNPGICKERARFEYDERMRTKREEWEEERIQREANRAKEAEGERGRRRLRLWALAGGNAHRIYVVERPAATATKAGPTAIRRAMKVLSYSHSGVYSCT
jgi:hypothetical protein